MTDSNFRLLKSAPFYPLSPAKAGRITLKLETEDDIFLYGNLQAFSPHSLRVRITGPSAVTATVCS